MLPPGNESTSIRVPPFLFTKGVESSFYSEATLRMTCPIAGADFVDKLIPLDAAAKAAAKKRPKAPDLAEETEAKRQKKASGKAKPKPKREPKQPKESITAENKDTVAQLQSDMTFRELFGSGEVASSRPRRWLDDLVACLEKAYGKQLDKIDEVYTVTSKMGAVGTLLSMGLEFGLTGKLTVDKKTYKDWSKVGQIMFFFCQNNDSRFKIQYFVHNFNITFKSRFNLKLTTHNRQSQHKSNQPNPAQLNFMVSGAPIASNSTSPHHEEVHRRRQCQQCQLE